MKECKKRYTSTAAMVRHVRTAHATGAFGEGWEDYQRANYWAMLHSTNQDEYGRSTIKLPPSDRKQRKQSRKEQEQERRRLQGAGTSKSGKGGRRPKPIRFGRPSGKAAFGASKALALKSIDEPNPRQLTRALMKHPESPSDATADGAFGRDGTLRSSVSKATPALSKISTGDRQGSAPSSGKATAAADAEGVAFSEGGTFGTFRNMAEFKKWLAYCDRQQRQTEN